MCACVFVRVCSCVRGVRTWRAYVCMCAYVCQRKTKDRADGMRQKSAHSPRQDSNLYLWDRAHCASDYTTRVRLPRVSRNKHLRHSSVSSTAKQSCMKHSNSYVCVCVCVCACVRAWRVCVCVCVCARARECTYACVYACMRVRAFV